MIILTAIGAGALLITIVALLAIVQKAIQADTKRIDDFLRANKKPTAKERIKALQAIHDQEIAELKARWFNSKHQPQPQREVKRITHK